jgi:hypothetical protein
MRTVQTSIHRHARIGLLGLVFAIAAPLAAQIRTEAVVFPRGKTSTTLTGTLKGDLTRDYVVRASGGQQMTVTLSSANKSAYFNVLPPGSADEAIFIGSAAGNRFSEQLPSSGAYTVRVYLMRAAARQGQSAAFTLNIAVTGAMSGGGGGGRAAPARINDLAGMDAIRAIDVMTERGFRDSDSFGSGETRYGIFWRAASRQCVQLTFADNRVVAANDIGTHPKCR